MDRLLNHKAMVMGFSVLVLVLTVILASGMQTELMTSDDTGTVSVSIETRPGLKQEKIEEHWQKRRRLFPRATRLIRTCCVTTETAARSVPI